MRYDLHRNSLASLVAVVLLMLGACSDNSGMLDPADWQEYKSRFVSVEGRVLDNAHHNITHSEGQGYAMLLAVAFDDQDIFDQLWKWTQVNLQVREKDRLHAWKWEPEAGKATDLNNATDGDIAIAWALYRASEAWGGAEYQKAADAIVESLRGLLITAQGHLFLLPGSVSFTEENAYILNPSYLMFPAFREIAAYNSEIDWQGLIKGGRYLLEKGRFGRWKLAADWVNITDSMISVAPSRPPYCSYDAVRVPLFSAWAGEKKFLTPFIHFWNEFPMQEKVPDIVDLNTDFVHLDTIFRATRSIYALARHVADPQAVVEMPPVEWNPTTTYFDASLSLFSRMAWQEFDHSQGETER